MGIYKAINHIDTYRLKALSGRVKSLSGRASTKQTDIINKFILSKAPNCQNLTVVDIGCGDGSLLEKFSSAKLRVGIVPTQEEKSLLDKHWQGKINIQIGKAESTNLPDDFSDILILNGVIILLDDENSVISCLKEIRRISKETAWIYIGDVPEIDEMQGIKYDDSVINYLIYLYYNYGMSRLIKEIFKITRSLIGLDNYVIKPKKIFHITSDNFIKLCKRFGFNVLEYGKQIEWDQKQNCSIESYTRLYYILKIV